MDARNAATTDNGEDRNEVVGPRPQARSSISSLLFLTFMLFLMAGGGYDDDSLATRTHYRDALESLKYQQSNYTAWFNGTESNFSMPEEDPTVVPFLHSLVPIPTVSSEYATYYHNVSGFFNGPARFHNLTTLNEEPSNTSESLPWAPLAREFIRHADFNLSEIYNRSKDFQWHKIRKFTISMLELEPRHDMESIPEELVLLHGKVDFSTSDDGEIRLELNGVHFPKNGSFIGLSAPKGRFTDIRDLPSLVPSHAKNATVNAVTKELDRQIESLSTIIDNGSADSETSSNDPEDIPACDFVFYFQLESSLVPPHLLIELESEIENPTGISTIRAPPLILDGVLISRNCGILLEVNKGKGMKVQSFWRKATTYSGIAFVIYLGLLFLLMRQVESPNGRTPTGMSHVSRWCFLFQSVADGILFIGHVTFAIFSDNRMSLSIMAPGFLACVLLMYEVQHANLIHQVQGPEDAALRETSTTSEREGGDADANENAESRSWRVRIVNFIRSGINMDSQTRFWFMVVISMIYFFNVIFSPSLAIFTLGVIYSSLWIPQIYRSARRGTRPALNKEYLIGTTIGRSFFALYVFACPENILGVEPSRYVWIIVILLTLQVLVILGQDILGPSFFVPKDWVAVSAYNYHPPLPTSDTEAPKESLGDCAICMDPIVVHQEMHDSAGTQLLSSAAANLRKPYAWAPCHHIFHTHCLEQWMSIKNICPQCRRPLPPL
ncbi:hypothetical protein M422DRAFT_774359 [Sphaerobolus stellatus SS14]|nr:hypothetical protein M422DRAFT_774359 [Sphaerobolus stellatus SS14]